MFAETHGAELQKEVAARQREIRLERRGHDRFNSPLREALGSEPFILTKFDKFMNWVRGSSMFMLQFGIACCSLEMMHAYSTKHDLDRFGAGVPRASPRQADVIIVPGTIVSKFAPRMKRVYDQMPEPKFVVGMGVCTISGGPFQQGYNVVREPRRSSRSTSTSPAAHPGRRRSSTPSPNYRNASLTARVPRSS
jgi:NADH-quinone oxidoreductase subunit B